MENNKKVSIVIPIYNTEKYLRACFDSVIAQSYTNWELLAIDDGSTDGSPAVCDEYAKKDERIKVFHQKNMRIGAARNKGIENAGGHYITFLDSDDLLAENALETAMRILGENNADMVQWCAYSFADQEDPYKTGSYTPEKHKEILTDSMGALEILLDDKGKGSEFRLLWNYCRCVWSKLCKKEVFEGIRFPIGTEYEDDYIVHRLFLAASKIVFINDKLTNYRIHSQSTLHLMGLKGRFDKLECEYQRFQGMLELGCDRLIRLSCHKYFISLLNIYLECGKQGEELKGKELAIRAKQDIKRYGRYLNYLDKTTVITFYTFPRVFGSIYKIYRKVK